jgi:ketosteroid isomerase-like protein
MRWTPWFALLVLAAACGGPAPSTDTPSPEADAAWGMSPERRSRLEAELIQADMDFLASVKEHRIGGWISAFSADGMMVTAGGTAIGEEGIRRVMQPLFQDSTYQITWDPSFARVAASGNMGYTVGHAESQRMVDGETRVVRGSYLTVWRRQPDGKWKVEADIGSMQAASDQ